MEFSDYFECKIDFWKDGLVRDWFVSLIRIYLGIMRFGLYSNCDIYLLFVELISYDLFNKVC